MKVKELIEVLAGFPEDMEVLIASDEEGNSFSPLDSVYGYHASQDGNDYALWEEDEITDDDEEAESDWCKIHRNRTQPVLVIWP